MINKRISKITMLTALFIGGIVNAQEFYTCVPKKSWWMDTMGESIKRNVSNNLSDIIAAGVRKGQKQEWSLITTIDFTKILNDSNLNQNNISIYDKFLSPGTYKFRLILKHKDRSILNIFDNKLDLNKNGYLYQGSLYAGWYSDYHIFDFINLQNYNKAIFIQNRNLKDLDKDKIYHRVGVKNIRINDIVLFSWETIEEVYYNKQDYIIDNNFIYNYYNNNIFRYSTLEIYKQNDS